MSKSVNKVILLGNVGKAPEVKNSSASMRVTFSLATNERIKRGDKWEDHTEWHNVVLFGRLAEIARDYVHKGSKIYIEGRLSTYKYEDEQQQTRWITNVIGSEITLLDARESRPAQAPDAALAADNYGYGSTAKPTTASPAAISDDDIPF
jgi:single-strand DNA-binding protein